MSPTHSQGQGAASPHTSAAVPHEPEAASLTAVPPPTPLSVRSPFPRSALHENAEVYGFCLWVSTFCAGVLYLVWALAPDAWLHSALGLTYHPDKWWALAGPAWGSMTLVSVPLVYALINMANTLPLDHPNSMADVGSRTDRQQRHTEHNEEAGEKQPQRTSSSSSSSRASRPRCAASAPPATELYSIPDVVDLPLQRINELLYQ